MHGRTTSHSPVKNRQSCRIGGFFVNRYQVQAVHTAYLITGDHAVAEDVVQTAFLRLADKIGLFDDQRDFRPWFLRSVVNDSIKEVKRHARNVSLDDPDLSSTGYSMMAQDRMIWLNPTKFASWYGMPSNNYHPNSVR